MASQGPLSPGTLADDSGVGTIAWSNPGNAAASDDSRATAVLGALEVSHYLKATNFGFSIPSGATINGIVVEIERSRATVGDSPGDNRVRIVKGGTIGSTDKAVTGTTWPTTEAYATYGTGTTDLWGETWSDTDINASNFGVVVSAKDRVPNFGGTARVDHIRITVYYTSSSPVTVSPSTLALSLSAFSPTIRTPRTVTPPTLALAATRYSPTVLAPRTVTPAAASLALTGFAPSVLTPRTAQPTAAALAISAFAPTVLAPRVVRPDAGTMTLATFAPSALTPRVADPGPASLALTGYAPSAVKTLSLSGVTRDCTTGLPLPGCAVSAFKTSDSSLVGTAVSDSLGRYSIRVPTSDPHFLVAYLPGSPDVAGTTRNDLTGV